MSRSGSGFFISVEGGDRAGKSSQLACIHGYLRDLGADVVMTREPGGTALGERLRRLLLHGDGDASPQPLTELLLLVADRAEHVSRLIRPALGAGRVVVSDRFADSSVAYQAYGLGLDVALVERMNAVATEGLKPDLTLLFDLPVELRDGRRGQSGADRIEGRDEAFHRRVRRGYLALAQKHRDRIEVIDASRPVEYVRRRVEEVLGARVPRDLR